MRLRNLLGLLALAAAGFMTSGCDFDGYCINCANGDGGMGVNDASVTDAGVDEDAIITDAGPPGDACVNSGIEVCDGIDNDCDDNIDEGDLDGVGVACSTDIGECVAGTTECTAGEIICAGGAVLPVPELCDGLDNDCDGTDDNGDPEGGGICGSDLGECVAGIKRCQNGGIICFGEVTGGPEVCDTKDNDCDGSFDESIPPGGSCGPTEGNTGECVAGQEQCIGGQMQCVGASYPMLEQCDAVDHDCDGNNTNGFDLVNNARTCLSCSNDCTDDFLPAAQVSSVRCGAAGCEIAACNADYFDTNGTYADGCERFCDTFTGPQEACDGIDNDCDGMVDEAVIPPEVCDINGLNCHDVCDISGTLCAGGASSCVAGAWTCSGWPATVETDASGNLVAQESICDGLDNDCDTAIDETFPTKGGSCFDTGIGVCRREGTLACNGTNDGLDCTNLSPVVNPGTEICNGLDDDCMGDIDEGFTNGQLQSWVDIGDGTEIFAYEASRPDATATTSGASETHVCADSGDQPWTGLTQPEAEAACATIGARLCTEAEWERACMTLREDFQQGGGGDFLVVMEAEDFHGSTTVALTDTGGTVWNYRWVPVPQPGFSGSSAMWVSPDSNAAVNNGNGPRLDYRINFTQTGTHYVWLRANDWNGFDDRVHIGLDGTISGSGNTVGRFGGGWTWHNRNTANQRVTINVPSAGVHTLNLFMRDEAAIVDKLIVTRNAGYTPTGTGPSSGVCIWGFGTNCTTYQANTCNGNDFDTDAATPGDQDDVLATGSRAACYADWGGAGRIYDMSGNVKEWTARRAPNQNPFRGGASNNAAGGITCKNDFGVVDDNFSFPNLGFRCCR